MARVKIKGVYKITNPEGCVYIGQSRDIVARWQAHCRMKSTFERLLYESLKKFTPKNHVFELIETCEIKDLVLRERHWQEVYLNSEITLLNIVLRKIGEFKTWTHESHKIIQGNNAIKNHTGLKRKESSKLKMRLAASNRTRSVIQLSLNGEYINEYIGACEAGRQTGLQRTHISDCCKGISKTHGGYKWVYKSEFNVL